MKDLEWFRKHKKEFEQEISKLSGSLDELKRSREDLDAQIDAAIDARNYSAVDSLTEQATELDNRIRTAEKILDRRKASSAFSKYEIIDSCNAEMKKRQAETEKAMNEAEKIRRQYFRQYFTALIRAGEIVRDAYDIRDEYLSFSDEPIGEGEIAAVHAGFHHKPFGREETDFINNEIRQDGISLIGLLRR